MIRGIISVWYYIRMRTLLDCLFTHIWCVNVLWLAVICLLLERLQFLDLVKQRKSRDEILTKNSCDIAVVVLGWLHFAYIFLLKVMWGRHLRVKFLLCTQSSGSSPHLFSTGVSTSCDHAFYWQINFSFPCTAIKCLSGTAAFLLIVIVFLNLHLLTNVNVVHFTLQCAFPLTEQIRLNFHHRVAFSRHCIFTY